jgi:type IV pilus assembly protein PilM
VARQGTGIDVGMRSAIAVRGAYKGGTFHLSAFSAGEHAVSEIADGWDSLDPTFKLTNARVGLSGRDLNVRYTRVPQVPDWQLRRLMRFEVEEVGDQSGSDVASDFNLLPSLPELEGEDVVLLAMARTSLMDTHEEGLKAAGGTLDCFSPNAVALYNAFLRYGVVQDDTVLIANIGHDNIDVVISRGPDLLFARNLTGGGRLMDDAISQRLGTEGEQAEKLKRQLATLRSDGQYDGANQEKVSRAIMAAGGQLLSLLQSAVLFCKTQVKISTLQVDRVLVCGGGAQLDGLCSYLSSGMSVPVDLFDPWQIVDTSALDDDSAAELEQFGLRSVVALGLATMSSDPEAYSLELLSPDALKKREFFGGQIFLWAAALLAVAYLGYFAKTSSTQTAERESKYRVRNGELSRKKSADEETKRLLVENADLAKSAAKLQRIVGAGEQLARTLEVLGTSLPSDFWITRLQGRWGVDKELGIDDRDDRPLILLEGAQRTGSVSPVTQYQELREQIETRLEGVRVVSSYDAKKGFSFDLTTFAPSVSVSDPDESDEEDV